MEAQRTTTAKIKKDLVVDAVMGDENLGREVVESAYWVNDKVSLVCKAWHAICKSHEDKRKKKYFNNVSFYRGCPCDYLVLELRSDILREYHSKDMKAVTSSSLGKENTWWPDPRNPGRFNTSCRSMSLAWHENGITMQVCLYMRNYEPTSSFLKMVKVQKFWSPSPMRPTLTMTLSR